MHSPRGDSDLKHRVEEKLPIVDKSLWIKEFLEAAEVVLITRPPGFGKTFNLSMLRYFFEYPSQTKNLFQHLKIASEKGLCLKYQGRYPVIYFSFKEVKETSYSAAYQKILAIITNCFAQFIQILLSSDKITDFQKSNIKKIITQQASLAEVSNSLFLLSKALHDYYGRKAIILIDDYDTPLQAGYWYNYHNDIAVLLDNLLGPALKDNKYLFKSLLTGNYSLVKETGFSGLNHVKNYSVWQPTFGTCFGFMEEEVKKLLHQATLEEQSKNLQDWYSGYRMGSDNLYHPGSVISSIHEGGSLKSDGIKNNDRQQMDKLLLKSSRGFQEQILALLEGKSIKRLIDENFAISDPTQNNETRLWHFLLLNGYLTIMTSQYTDQGMLCELAIPNQAVRNFLGTFFGK